jgi:hypothetical protein
MYLLRAEQLIFEILRTAIRLGHLQLADELRAELNESFMKCFTPVIEKQLDVLKKSAETKVPGLDSIHAYNHICLAYQMQNQTLNVSSPAPAETILQQNVAGPSRTIADVQCVVQHPVRNHDDLATSIPEDIENPWSELKIALRRW